ncbi:MFS transporter [Embleya sp. AB8]|uniref:MFS transporter n=1 Tax=Embleya sp. AB8 TaxID=3156304 RepID=UPI003C750CAC
MGRPNPPPSETGPAPLIARPVDPPPPHIRAAPGRFTRENTAIAAAFVLFVLLGCATAALGSAMPALRREYGGGNLVIVYNLGAFLTIAVLGFGRWSERARALSTGPLAGAFVVGCLVIAWAPDRLTLIPGVALAGAGYGGLALALNSAFARGFGERRVTMLNLLNGAFGAGAVCGPIAVAMADDPGTVFLLLAVAIPLTWPVHTRAAAGAPADHTPAEPVPVPVPVRQRAGTWAPFALLTFVYAGIETGIGAWESTHLTELGTGSGAAAVFTALFWTSLALGRLLVPVLAPDVPPGRLVVGGLAGATLLLPFAAFGAATPVVYASVGVALAPVLPSALAWMAAVTGPAVADRSTATLLTASMIGGACLSLPVQLAADSGHPAAIPWTFAAIGCVACAAALLTMRTTRPRD